MKPLSLLVGLVVAVSAQAQSDFRLTDSPKHRAMGKTMARLKAMGWMRSSELQVDSPFPNPAIPRSVLTRAIADTLKALPANLDAERTRLESQFSDPAKLGGIEGLRRDIRLFDKELMPGIELWVEEFSSDLGARKPSVLKDLEESKEKDRDLVAAYRKAISLRVPTYFGDFPAGLASFPDIPSNHPLYRLEARLKPFGWIVGPELGFIGGRPRSRSIFAELAIETIEALPRNLDDAVVLLQEQIATRSFTDAAWRLFDRRDFFESELAPGLRKWVKEFAPEIAKLDSSPETLLSNLDDLESARHELVELCRQADNLYWNRFPDVPAGHWAERAIKDLRDAGIIEGYPNGRFHALIDVF